MKKISKNLVLFFAGISVTYGMNQDPVDGQSSSNPRNQQVQVIKKRTEGPVVSFFDNFGYLPKELLTIIFKEALQPKRYRVLTTEPIAKGIECLIRQATSTIKWKEGIDEKAFDFLSGGGVLESKKSFHVLPDGKRVPVLLPPLTNFTTLLHFLKGMDAPSVLLDDKTLYYFSMCGKLTTLTLSCHYGCASGGCYCCGGERPSDRGLTYLARLTNLKKLSLKRFTGIKKQGLSVLSSLVNLTSLTLVNPQLRDFGGKLDILSKLIQLNSLILKGSRSLKESGAICLSYLSNLTSLKLCSMYLPRNTIGILANPSKLSSLSLSKSMVDENDFIHLSRLENLLSLDLTCSCILNEHLLYLSKLTKLTFLDLTEDLPDVNEIRDGISTLSNLVNLTSFSASGCGGMTDERLSYLSYFTNLTDLNLDRMEDRTDNGLVHFSNFKNLTKLCLDGSLTGKGLTYFSKCTNLRTLNFDLCESITDSGLLYVSNFTKLMFFEFSLGAKITEQGIFKLFSNADFKYLRCYHRRTNRRSQLNIDDKITQKGLHFLDGIILRNYYREYPEEGQDQDKYFQKWQSS